MIDKAVLESLYDFYNTRRYVHPDPLEFLYRCESPHDREIVALIASSLAYGRVVQILRSVESILSRMPSPADFLKDSSRDSLRASCADFKHRFTTGRHMADLLYGIKRVRDRFGSLYECFLSAYRPDHATVIPALGSFVEELREASESPLPHLLPKPGAGSACKRVNLFLRWMVRRDEVDPGGWDRVSPAKLVVPLDTHMRRICFAIGLTRRRGSGLKTALEITEAFKRFAPDDPVRYDFALTRLGIRKDADLEAFLNRMRAGEASTGI